MCAPTTSTTPLHKVDQGQSDSNTKALPRTPTQPRISIEQVDIMTPVRVVPSLQTKSAVVTSAYRIRSRFLHRLGIEISPSQNLSHETPASSKVCFVSATYTPRVRRDSRLRDQVNCQARLPSGVDTNLQNKAGATIITLSKNSKEQRKRVVTFHNEVTIHPIPTRHEYSERVRKLLWSTPQELQMNAVRNTVEFASEGWNWRNVILDHEMIRNSFTGELVHPIHFYMKREFNLQQHFVQVMAARASYHPPDHHRNNYSNVRKATASPHPQPSCVAISM